MPPALLPTSRRARRRALLAVLGALAFPLPGSAAPPAGQRCPTLRGPAVSAGEDAAPRALEPGMGVTHAALPALRHLLPEEVWAHRDVFFSPGMLLEIGACHRHYPAPAFFEAATRRFAGRARLDERGNLEGSVAGLPFPPAAIDPEAEDAGLRWAWNLERRFRGAGPVGSFRIVDLAGRVGRDQTYEGTFFFLQTGHRADLADQGYATPDAEDSSWVAGGRFHSPSDARHLAWRQLRPAESATRSGEPDDIFVYVPTMRKVRRAATSWVDGFYLPRVRLAGDGGGGGIAIGGNEYSGARGAINPTAAKSIQITENLRVGFASLALRPNAYVWRLRGEREVLAPLNARRPGYPLDRDRNYGPHGLSVANDRWDVRQAVVIDGLPRRPDAGYAMITFYVDWQTQQPLYVVTRGRGRRILEVGIPVHRYSEDTLNYPEWASGDRAQVFDPVAEVFYRVHDDSGWRRESYDAHSTPADERERRRFVSSDYLVRGR